MVDFGFTHIGLPVTNLDASIEFYAKYAQMQVVHRRPQKSNPRLEIAWLSDLTRPFALGLAEEAKVEPFAHLGVACKSREEMDSLCEEARREGILLEEPVDSHTPAGYLALITDPDGHTLELSYGQEIEYTIQRTK